MCNVDLPIYEELRKRDLPKIFEFETQKKDWLNRRNELINIMAENLYGHTPSTPAKIRNLILSSEENLYGGKVRQDSVKLSFDTPNGEFSFQVNLLLPNNIQNPPVILHIAFRPELPDRYVPVEEILDNGFALAHFCYEDIVKDSHDGNFDQGLLGCYHQGGNRQPNEWGKIGAWAFAASRVMDYLQTLDCIDKKHIAVMGHSRLAKTALWCGALDERFFAVISNNGCLGGDSLFKGGKGEKVSAFIKYGSCDWFCENFKKWEGQEDNLSFDQHFLLALIAPRYLYIGTAEEDYGADPRSEFLACVAASEVYQLLCGEGLAPVIDFPKAPYSSHVGRIGYHIRAGNHFLSRYDWNQYMSFLKKKIDLENETDFFKTML